LGIIYKSDTAAEICKKAIAVCSYKSNNWENCYNILHNFYKTKDNTNFFAFGVTVDSGPVDPPFRIMLTHHSGKLTHLILAL
jgi:hypothetical protein